MNIHRVPIAPSIKTIVADIEAQSARNPYSPAVVMHSELRRVIRAAAQGDEDAMRLAAIIMHVPAAARALHVARPMPDSLLQLIGKHEFSPPDEPSEGTE